MRFSGILLDLDNTVYPYDVAHAAAMDKVFPFLSKELKRPLEDIRPAFEAAKRAVKKRIDGFAASHSRLLYFQTLCESLRVPLSNIAIVAEDLYWETFFDHMVMRPQCLEFLRAVRPIPIVVITDQTARLQLEKVIHLKLQEYIFAIVSSEEAGYEKPHPRIFELAAEKLSADPSTLCMIGDDWDKDIVGALRFNMHCYWFRESKNSSEQKKQQATPSNERVHKFSHFSELMREVESVV